MLTQQQPSAAPTRHAATGVRIGPTSGRVALVWAAEQPLPTISVRYERYIRGFRALGLEAFAVCSEGAAAGFAEPVVRAPAASLRNRGFWRALRPDAAVVITWLGLPDVVGSLRETCAWVASVADSDGQVGVRVHPRATLVRGVFQHADWITRARAFKFWLQRYLFDAGRPDETHLTSADRADMIAVCSPPARDHLTAFFHHHRRPDLAARIAVIPYPVDYCYLHGEVHAARSRRLVAVGRWNDPQKDAPLLAAAVHRALAADPDVGFDLVGPGGEAAFAGLCRRQPRVRYHGPQSPEVVAELLRRSRSLFLSSRWESGPIVANEALSLGCTLVGPVRVPTFEAYCRGGRYGTACRGGSPQALATAVLDEMRAWDDGRRDPAAIAATWRPRFDPRTVCGQLLRPSDMPCD